MCIVDLFRAASMHTASILRVVLLPSIHINKCVRIYMSHCRCNRYPSECIVFVAITIQMVSANVYLQLKLI